MDTILFDLDGTITDSARGIVDCFRHALAVVGAPPADEEVLRGVVGPPIVHTFRRLGLVDADVRRARAAYRERYESHGWAENAVYPGMAELLRRLVASGVTLGVATSKNERMARQILRHFDLDRPFAFIGGASDDDSRIDKGDVIAHTLRALGRPPASPEQGGTPGVVLVGDRRHDVQGAARFGLPTVLVTWGYGTPDEHRTARWTVSTPEQLGDLLDRLTAGSTAA
jgi:phosphoglycolate phosphatase-like HAD superfamily hydrolase